MGVDARTVEEKAGKLINKKVRHIQQCYGMLAKIKKSGSSWAGRQLLPLALVCLMLMMHCSRQAPVKDPSRPVGEIPDQEGWSSTVTSTNKGKIEAIVHYGHMARFNQSRLVKFDGNVQVDFFDEAGRLRSVLTADSGELHEASNDIAARGHVKVVSDTLTLWTEELRYEQASARIRSDVDVKFVTLDGDTLYGKGFESDSRLRNYRITHLRGIAHKRIDLAMDKLVKPVRRDSAQAQKP